MAPPFHRGDGGKIAPVPSALPFTVDSFLAPWRGQHQFITHAHMDHIRREWAGRGGAVSVSLLVLLLLRGRRLVVDIHT